MILRYLIFEIFLIVINVLGVKVNYEFGVIDLESLGFFKFGVFLIKVYFWKYFIKRNRKLVYYKNFNDFKIIIVWNFYLFIFWMWNYVIVMKGLNGLKIGVIDIVNLEIRI